MKRILIGLIIGVLGGTVFGFALGIFVYPYWFLNDVATETLAPVEQRSLVAGGMFIHANPSDPIHWGKGDVKVYRDPGGQILVHLEESFQVGPGPRFHVYLTEKADILNDADFEASEKLDLGRLRAFQGSQIFNAPAGTQIADYGSVVIWCKEFGVLISPATLSAAAT